MFMKTYLEKLKAYVEAHPIQFDDGCGFSALNSLYWHYSECHNMSNEKTKYASANLSACLNDFSHENCEQVYGLVNALCAEYEEVAFLAGIQLGAQLMLELQQEEGEYGQAMYN